MAFQTSAFQSSAFQRVAAPEIIKVGSFSLLNPLENSIVASKSSNAVTVSNLNNHVTLSFER